MGYKVQELLKSKTSVPTHKVHKVHECKALKELNENTAITIKSSRQWGSNYDHGLQLILQRSSFSIEKLQLLQERQINPFSVCNKTSQSSWTKLKMLVGPLNVSIASSSVSPLEWQHFEDNLKFIKRQRTTSIADQSANRTLTEPAPQYIACMDFHLMYRTLHIFWISEIEDIFLVTLDQKPLYTNNVHSESKHARKDCLSHRKETVSPTNFLLELMEWFLNNNVFFVVVFFYFKIKYLNDAKALAWERALLQSMHVGSLGEDVFTTQIPLLIYWQFLIELWSFLWVN